MFNTENMNELEARITNKETLKLAAELGELLGASGFIDDLKLIKVFDFQRHLRKKWVLHSEARSCGPMDLKFWWLEVS